MSWVDKIFSSSTVTGIEVILGDEEKVYNYSILKKAKDSFELLLAKNNEQVTEPSEILSGAPVCVAINGKGIIHKKIHAAVNADDRLLLGQVLPAANPDDFFLQRIIASENNLFVSVIRKTIVKNILETLKAVLPKNEIVSVTLGPFCVLKILPSIGHQDNQNELRFAGHQVTYLPGGIIHEYLSDKINTERKFNFGSITVNEVNLVSLSAAYQYYTGSNDCEARNIPLIEQARKHLAEKKKFELTLASVLGFFLLVLIFNYFLFDHYWSKKNELSTVFALNQDAFLKLEKLKSEFSEKQNFLQNTGFFEPSRLSYYADQVALDLPESILLTQLNIYPLKTKVNNKENITFTNKKIIVSGTCRKSTEINEWIKSLKQKKWIDDLTMLNYSFDKSKELADFTIEITAKPSE